MIVHLVDGTFELFRCFYGLRKSKQPDDPYGAVRVVVNAMLQMVETGGTHIGIATDHVIESFRNRLWAGYKTGEGIDPVLRAQFTPLEEALSAFGFAVWPMIELEADDALASAAYLAFLDARVQKISIWTPDKDLAQCVRGDRVVQVDRRTGSIRDEAGVREKFGVAPESIPDYLGLVGDSADGYPGLPGWGAKSAAAVLAKFGHLENIPERAEEWRANVANVAGLSNTLRTQWELALLFRDLATLRINAPLFENVDQLKWQGPAAGAATLAQRMNAGPLLARAERLANAL